jgi:hypothetical protein
MGWGDQVPPNGGLASGVWKGRTKQRAKAFRFTATQIHLVKSKGNLQFPPTYRAFPKNILNLRKGLGWGFSGARQLTALSLSAIVPSRFCTGSTCTVRGMPLVPVASLGARNLTNG